MTRKNKNNEPSIDYSQMKTFYPNIQTDPLKKAAWDIERIIIESGLSYCMEYRPDDNFFTVRLYNKNKEK